MRAILFLQLLSFSFYLHAADSRPTFDNVIWGNAIVTEKVEAGFGTYAMLELINAEEIAPHYQNLRKYGRVRVFVQKLAPQNEGETKTTRYTFEAYRRIGFTQSELTATWTVDVYSSINIMDDVPNYYRIGDIVPTR